MRIRSTLRQKPIHNWVQRDTRKQTTDNPNRRGDMTNIPKCYLTRFLNWKSGTKITLLTPPNPMQQLFSVRLGLNMANELLTSKFFVTSEALHMTMNLYVFSQL